MLLPTVTNCTTPEADQNPTAVVPLQTGVSLRRRRGATMMEYLAVASLILLAVILGVGYFGQETRKVAQDAADAIQQATDPNAPSGP